MSSSRQSPSSGLGDAVIGKPENNAFRHLGINNFTADDFEKNTCKNMETPFKLKYKKLNRDDKWLQKGLFWAVSSLIVYMKDRVGVWYLKSSWQLEKLVAIRE